MGRESQEAHFVALHFVPLMTGQPACMENLSPVWPSCMGAHKGWSAEKVAKGSGLISTWITSDNASNHTVEQQIG